MTKPTKEFFDSTAAVKIKANMDIELWSTLWRCTDHVDHIIPFSGDGTPAHGRGDQRKGKKVR